MGSGWRRARNALFLHMCGSIPQDRDEIIIQGTGLYNSGAEGAGLGLSEGSTTSLAPITPTRSPSRLQLIRTSIRLSRSTCAICLETMKAGFGHALFTAECSHAFHFSCIASNVRHGNLVCPVCRAKWKEVPWQAPVEAPNEHKALTRSTRLSVTANRNSPRQGMSEEAQIEAEEEMRRLDPVLRILDESIANARGIRRISPPEPSVFDDDEPLIGLVVDDRGQDEGPSFREGITRECSIRDAIQRTGLRVETSESLTDGEQLLKSREDSTTENVTNCDFAKITVEGEEVCGDNLNFTQKLEVHCCAEFESIPCVEARENFTVLVHLKASAHKSKEERDNEINPQDQAEQKSELGYKDISTSPSARPSQSLDQSCRAPIDLVTVLDVSGSMAGNKLLLLKRAMGFVIRNLSPADRLSVVAFSSSAKRLFPLKRMVEDGRQQALRAIESLVSTGGTNISEGLRKGAKVLEDRHQCNPVASIMLLSDGQDTYNVGAQCALSLAQPGGSDYRHLIPLSLRQCTQSGHAQIPVHSFGFGADHDAAIMHFIAEASGGTFSFIQAEGAVQDAFAQCIGGLLSVVIQDVELRISTLRPGVQLTAMQTGSYDCCIANQGACGIVKLGDLYAEEERDILLELTIPTLEKPPSGLLLEMPVVQVQCICKEPVSRDIYHTQPSQLTILRPHCLKSVTQTSSLEVDRQRNRLMTAQAIVQAGSLADAGDIAGAQRTLQLAKHALQNSTASKAGDHLSNALETELSEIQLRMANRQMYERSGRAYILSAQSSHFRQRATARGDYVDSHSRDYQTPSMVDMILRSQTHVSLPSLSSTTSMPTSRQAYAVAADGSSRRSSSLNSTRELLRRSLGSLQHVVA